jgi:hypothetical protein
MNFFMPGRIISSFLNCLLQLYHNTVGSVCTAALAAAQLKSVGLCYCIIALFLCHHDCCHQSHCQYTIFGEGRYVLVQGPSGLEIREYGHGDPSRWPRGTPLTSGDRSVGIVGSRTQATEFKRSTTLRTERIVEIRACTYELGFVLRGIYVLGLGTSLYAH